MEGSFAVRLTLRASISPTEDRSRVLAAAANILGTCDYEMEEGGGAVFLSTDAGCLRNIRDQLRDRHVRNAAWRLLVKSKDGDKMSLMFNRQAASVGVVAVVSSAEESPLGPLTLQIECDRPDELMDWLTVPREEERPGPARREPLGSS